MTPDDAFDDLIREIQMRDRTPRPASAFVGTLQATLLTSPHRARARTGPWRTMPTAQRWVGLAATIALLLAVVVGGYQSGMRLPSDGGAATNIAAPMTVSPIAEPAIAGSCEEPKTYLSGIQGRTFLYDSSFFGDGTYAMDHLELHRWALGPDATHEFPSSQPVGVSGIALDTVAAGVYQATFDGPVIVTTSYGDVLSQTFTRLEAATNTVELGPGESVLFEIGTTQTITNLSPSRSLSIERAYLYSGDGAMLTPTAPDTFELEFGRYKAEDPIGRGKVAARVSGTGSISSDEVLPNWDRTSITLEYVAIYEPAKGFGVLVPPCGLGSDASQVRDVDEITTEGAGYSGYLVWLAEGGRG